MALLGHPFVICCKAAFGSNPDIEATSTNDRSTHLRHHRAIFAVMHSGLLAQRYGNVWPRLEEGRPMRRRDFMRLLGGAATMWPLGARAQQWELLRRIGVLMSTAADDPEGQARIAAFQQGLQQFNWTIGRNVR